MNITFKCEKDVYSCHIARVALNEGKKKHGDTKIGGTIQGARLAELNCQEQYNFL